MTDIPEIIDKEYNEYLRKQGVPPVTEALSNNNSSGNDKDPLPSASPDTKCPKCKGDGYYADHDIPGHHDPETGECLTCPIQQQCRDCFGTGVDNPSIDTCNCGHPEYEQLVHQPRGTACYEQPPTESIDDKLDFILNAFIRGEQETQAYGNTTRLRNEAKEAIEELISHRIIEELKSVLATAEANHEKESAQDIERRIRELESKK